jgi:hypothetical protein
VNAGAALALVSWRGAVPAFAGMAEVPLTRSRAGGSR